MKDIEDLVELGNYCKQNKWPRRPQWMYWIYSRNPIAFKCVKKIGGRYLIDLEAFQAYIKEASIDSK